MGKKLKRGCALALAVLLGLSCLIQIRTQAAGGIETDRKDCTLTISTDILRLDGENVGESSNKDDLKDDLNKMKISVALYRVAKVDVSGRYTAVDSFKKMDLSGINSKTTADDWEVLAREAAGYLNTNVKPYCPKQDIIRPGGSTEAASTKFEGLETGLYLVVPEKAYNTDYTVQYQFSPYLTALPSSEYTLTGSGSDEWKYDTEIGLKAERVPLYGKLNITKSLLNYNETLGPATFVFEIEGRDKYDKVVYSNVISITHEGPDSKTVTLENLPAGLEMTVTEVYSGASYELASGSAKEQKVRIVSDEAVKARIGSEASVTFANQYNGGNRGGYGATNHFDANGDGEWTWVNPLPSSSTE